MPLPPPHAALVANLSSPATLAPLSAVLAAAPPRSRLPLATAVCRAAQSRPSPLAQAAWRAAVHALIDVAPSLAAEASAGVYTYAALYALAVACGGGEENDGEGDEAQGIAAEALKIGMGDNGGKGNGRDGWLDSVVFEGAGRLGVHRLLPKKGKGAGVVVPALVARIAGADAPLGVRVRVARAVLDPWLRAMEGEGGGVEGAEAYRRKTRVCLERAAGKEEDRVVAMEARVCGACIWPGDAAGFAQAVLKAGKRFVRAGGGYGEVVRVYRWALADFEGWFEDGEKEDQDVAAWFDFCLVCFATAEESEDKREGIDLARTLVEKAGKKGAWRVSAELQALLVEEGLYCRDCRQWPGVGDAADGVEEIVGEWLGKASGKGVRGLRVAASCGLRILRVLEPVRASLAAAGAKSRSGCEPGDVVRLCGLYPAVLSKALKALDRTVEIAPGSVEEVLKTWLLAMTGAALTACESLLIIYTTGLNGARVDAVLEQCRVLVSLSEEQSVPKWSQWLAVTLNNVGVDTYNRHVKRVGRKDWDMMSCSALLMRTSAIWITVTDLECVRSTSWVFDRKSCRCRRIGGGDVRRCLKRLAFSADAYLASWSKLDVESLCTAATALHLCFLSGGDPSAELDASFSRAAGFVASRDPNDILPALFVHCSEGDAERLQFVEVALSALRRYGVESLRKTSAADSKNGKADARSKGLLIAQQTLLRWMIAEAGQSGVATDYSYLLQRLNVALGAKEGLCTAQALRDRLHGAMAPSKPSPSKSWNGRSRSAPTLERKESGSTTKFFSDLVSAWVEVEDLDLSSVAKALSHLESAVAGVSKLSLDSSFVWHHVLELGEWMASVLELYDVDETAIGCCQIVRKACSKLGVSCSGFGLANLYRKIGWSERCLTALGDEDSSVRSENLGVHGHLLNDLARFDDAEIVLSGRREGVCCAVLGDAVLFGRGDVASAARHVKGALKAVLKTFSSGTSRDLFGDSANAFSAGGVSFHVPSMQSADLSRTSFGRLRRKHLLHLLDCLAKLGILHDRADCVSDARYYAQKAVELSALIGSPSLEVQCFLRTVTYPQPLNRAAEEFGDIQSILDLGCGEDSEVVNSLTSARVFMAKGDACLAVVTNERGLYEGSVFSVVGNLYDEAAELLDYQNEMDEVDSDIVTSVTADLLTKRGLLLLHDGDYSSASSAFSHALSFSSVCCRETQLAALVGAAETDYRHGEGRDAFSNLEDARQLMEVGTIARPRLVGKLWRLLGEVQLSIGAGGRHGGDAANCFARGHGTSLGSRRLLVSEQKKDISLDSESSDDDDVAIDSLTRRISSMSLSKAPVERIQSSLLGADTLIGLTCSVDKSSVFMWRITCFGAFSLRLPIPVDGPLSVRGVNQRLTDILNAAKATSSGVGGRALSAREKSAWWKKRFKLDEELGHLLAEIEDCWFGECRSLFLPASFVSSDGGHREPFETAYRAAVSHFPALVNPVELGSVLDKLCCKDIVLDCSAWAEEILQRVHDSRSPAASAKPASASSSRVSTRSRRSTKSKKSQQPPVSASPVAASCAETSVGELLLALDGPLENLPWECLPVLRSANCGTTRVLHESFLTDKVACGSSDGVDASSVYYLLNPSGDLKATQETFQSTFEAEYGWTGDSGRDVGEDIAANLSQFEVSDVFLYCGHGGAEAYIPPRRLTGADSVPVSVLMGCSSGRMQQYTDNAASSGTAVEYVLAGAPAVVANLWDVSDRDIDRLTSSLLADWLGVGSKADALGEASANTGAQKGTVSLAVALASARNACRLPFLVGAATVCYGRPRIHRL